MKKFRASCVFERSCMITAVPVRQNLTNVAAKIYFDKEV